METDPHWIRKKVAGGSLLTSCPEASFKQHTEVTGGLEKTIKKMALKLAPSALY